MVSRAIGEGELIPVSAVGSVEGVRLASLVLEVGGALAASVQPGATVDLWAARQIDSGEFAARQRNNCRTRIFNMARHLFQQQFDEGAKDLESHLQAVVKREADPRTAANVLLGWNS